MISSIQKMAIIALHLILAGLLTIFLVAMVVSMKLNGVSADISITVVFSELSITGTIFFIVFVKNIRYI